MSGKALVLAAGFSSLAMAVTPSSALADNGGRCTFQVPPDAKIVALGVYEGMKRSAVQLPNIKRSDRNHRPETRDVTASVSGRGPYVLVVSAQAPVIWTIDPSSLKALRGVLVFGYYSQAISGLPASIPHKIFVDGAERDECEDGATAYEGGIGLERLNESVKRVTGRAIDAFSGQFQTSSITHSEPGIIATHLAPLLTTLFGKFGQNDVVGHDRSRDLEPLVRSGAIRLATRGDVEAFEATLTKNSRTGHLARVEMPRVRDRLYAILRDVEFPSEMSDVGGGRYIVMPHVKKIKLRGNHSTFYDVATGDLCHTYDGKCRGVEKIAD